MPLPKSRPFFQRDPGLIGFSALPGLRGTDGVVDVEYVGEKALELGIVIGGRGNRWLCCFPSSARLVGDSAAIAPARGCRGVTAPLCILELGPGLVILGLGIGEHSGLHLRVTAPLCILELGPGLVILGLGIGEHSGLHLRVTAPLCILELGPGLVILGLGIGEHSGLHLLCGQNRCPDISPPTELCPEL